MVFIELVVFWCLSSCKTLPHLSLWDAFPVGPLPALPSKYHKYRKCNAMFSWTAETANAGRYSLAFSKDRVVWYLEMILCSYFPGLCFLYIQVSHCHLQWDTTCTGLLHARFCDGFHHSLLLSHWSFFCVCTFSKKTACWALSPLGLIPQAFLESRSYNKGCRKNRADQWTQSCCAVVFSPLTQSMRICVFLPICLFLLLLSQKVLSQKLPSFLFG